MRSYKLVVIVVGLTCALVSCAAPPYEDASTSEADNDSGITWDSGDLDSDADTDADTDSDTDTDTDLDSWADSGSEIDSGILWTSATPGLGSGPVVGWGARFPVGQGQATDSGDGWADTCYADSGMADSGAF